MLHSHAGQTEDHPREKNFGKMTFGSQNTLKNAKNAKFVELPNTEVIESKLHRSLFYHPWYCVSIGTIWVSNLI
jgi:hypothetical protein